MAQVTPDWECIFFLLRANTLTTQHLTAKQYEAVAQTKFQFAVEQANFLQNYRNTACWIPFAICDMEQTWPLTNLKITFKNQLEQENQVPHQVSRPQELRGCSFPPQNNPWRIEPKRKQPATETSWVQVSQQTLTCWWTLNRCPLKSPGQPAISVWGIQRPNVP